VTEADQNLVGEVLNAKQRLNALPQPPAEVAQAVRVLDEGFQDYQAAVEAVNVVERKIEDFERVAQDAGWQRVNKIGAVPATPADLPSWSEERRRLNQLIKDTGEVIDYVYAHELVPAREKLADQANRLRNLVYAAVTVEAVTLQKLIDSGAQLSEVQRARFANLVVNGWVAVRGTPGWRGDSDFGSQNSR
jgi:hypothetical protein